MPSEDRTAPLQAHRDFLDSFNEDLASLDCGARVAALASTVHEMEIVDLDGRAIGRIPTRIEPETFAAVMRLVEQSFEQGVVVGRTQAC